MSKPSISIITPVWNGLPYLRECVHSVLMQDFSDWELLISDNGSTDGTLVYLDSLTDPRIRVFKQQENLGIMGNLNFLFSQAEAPLSQILCADDYFIHGSSLSTIIDCWQQASADTGFVCFNHGHNSRSRTIQLENKITPDWIPAKEAAIWFFLFGNIPGNLSNVSLRTHLVAELGGFDKTLPAAGDFDFWSRATRSYAMGVKSQKIIYVRRHPKTASNYLNKKGTHFFQQVQVYERLIRELSSEISPWKLWIYFNLKLSVVHTAIGIKQALHGHFHYIREVLRTPSQQVICPKGVLLVLSVPLALVNRNQYVQAAWAAHFIKRRKRIVQKPATYVPTPDYSALP